MNKEQFIATLQACYFGDKGAYNLILKEYEKTHNKIDKVIEYMKDFIFEPLLVNEDRKLIMFNENLRKFEEILKGDVNE